jgi:hypothetical protein
LANIFCVIALLANRDGASIIMIWCEFNLC